VSLNVSPGGVPQLPVERAEASPRGVAGDKQRNLKYHGGPSRAVSIYSLDLIDALRREGHPIEIGAVGENLTLAGIDWTLMIPGARLRVGDAELELTAFAAPCRTIAGSFNGRRMGPIAQTAKPGWSRLYARVAEVGDIWRECGAEVLA
jgi:MOSC domain-containing protein YiiM